MNHPIHSLRPWPTATYQIDNPCSCSRTKATWTTAFKSQRYPSSILTTDNQNRTANCRTSLTNTPTKLPYNILLRLQGKIPQEWPRPYEKPLGRKSSHRTTIFNNSINNKRKQFLTSWSRLTSLKLLIKSFSQKSKKNTKKLMNNLNQLHSNKIKKFHKNNRSLFYQFHSYNKNKRFNNKNLIFYQISKKLHNFLMMIAMKKTQNWLGIK